MYRYYSLPKVGIRPTIDGREKGVRESLEDQTMQMAYGVAEFIQKEMKHASGEAVECVVADTTIGGIADAAACDEKFQKENVQISLTVTPCWCYGTETIDMHPTRLKAIWGFNGTERPGAVYLAAAVAGHDQIGLPVFSIYGEDVQDANDQSIPKDVKEKIKQFIQAALVVTTMKDKSYLSVGGVSMGIAGSYVDMAFFNDYLGMRTEFVDMCEVNRRLTEAIYDEEEYNVAMRWVKENCQEGADRNKEKNKWSREKLDEDWSTVVKMTLIMRDLMVGNPKLQSLGFGEESKGHYSIAAGFQGQRHWTDHMPNGDFLETILNSTFDWQGIRQSYIVATENDSLNAVPMLFGHLLTGQAQIFSDVRTYWSKEAVQRVTGHELEGLGKDGILHLINSGSTALDGSGEAQSNGQHVLKPFYEMTEKDVTACLEATEFCPADAEYFRGGGFSTRFTSKGNMPLTMARINMIKGLGPVMQIVEGHTVELPKEVHDVLDERTNPTWPTTWFAPKLTGKGPFDSVYEVMNSWGANHGALCYGHIGDLLITLCAMLRIPVAMHNVEENRIFRPKAWKAFGTDHLESADFRACKAYGPLYKK